ncbi:curved DNA binding protein DnaJ [Legionella beliardensis]|uniref:Curved DNA binding protein DnaJ n=1 Tax=Legionella beliardensis TaxID=91822 RepID=A0A378I4S8_9GAMM|nr:DnaJ C-terminal domain-containing protein [Legionella beliardensis]STX30199.1 curved DNA binding protein DnaJ [Legionella beliardensis]
MEYKDYYKIMGLERDVNQEEIKRAYRKLARKYHPDVSKEPNAENKFKELGEAYDVLKDPEKRAKYDQYGQYWQNPPGSAHGAHGAQSDSYQYSQHFDDTSATDFEDFLNNIFKQRYQQEQEDYFAESLDIHAKLTINLEDSFHGTEKTLQLQKPVMGPQGVPTYETRAIKVKIPKGVTDKQQIRLKGQGNQGRKHQKGDLYIEINIAPHPWYKLEKKDIHLELPITPWEATLGAAIQVPTLGGPVKLKIPKLSQTGKQMRLKGRGLPGQPPGDQIITLKIVISTTDNAEVNKLYEQIASATTFNPRKNLGVSDE